MRIWLVSLTFLLFFVSYARTGKGQSIFEKKVTVHFERADVKEILKKLSEQLDVNFAYKDADLTYIKEITLNADGHTLSEVLNYIFSKTDLKYVQSGNTILLLHDIRKSEEILNPADSTVEFTVAVVDENNVPISGAIVLLSTTPHATDNELRNFEKTLIKSRTFDKEKIGIADKQGRYRFNVLPGKYLVYVSYVGYETQYLIKDISSKNNGPFLVRLIPKSDNLNDVKITTGIFNKADRSFTGASKTVTTEELQRFGNRNLLTSLRNIDPSFNIIENNSYGSDPNHLPEVQIRGTSSIPNVNELQDQTKVALNTPLIVLDGFESSLQKLMDINPSDVATLTILKDASATAIYGSRGSNGVVVITTKAPKPGKLRISYRSDLTMELPDLSSYHLLNAREKLDLEYKAGYYDNARAENDLELKRYYNYLLDQINKGVNTDWLSIPLRNGPGQRHNIRLEGGDQSFRYSATAQYNDIEGVMKKSYRRTFNGTIYLSYQYKNIKISNELLITQGNTRNSPYGSFGDYVKMNPYWSPYDSNGNILKTLGDPGNSDYYYRWTTLPTNPLYNATLNDFDKSSQSEITNNTAIEWDIKGGLIFKARLGITKDISETNVFRSANNTAFANYNDTDIFRKGDYNYGISHATSYDGSLNLSYTKNIANKHTLFAGIDYNIRQNSSYTYGFTAEGFNNPNFDFISMALQYKKDSKPNGSESLTRAIGLTGNINYIYDNRYFADGSFRMDGSSQFGNQKRFAPFWSTGLGWNINNESFLINSKIINRLKLRGSVGSTGSQNFNAYQALSTYQYYTNDRYYTWNGAYLLGLGNSDLQWQQTLKYDIGTDAELFNQRLTLTADYYIQTTNNLVSSVNLPASNGFSSYIANIGKMRNTGYEIQATYFIIDNKKKAFSWSVMVAAVHNQNKIIETSQALKDAQASIQNATGDPGQLYVEGYSSNTIWVVHSLGIDPSTGKELYLTKDGKPTYTWSGDNVVASGNTDPKLFGNLSTMVRYKAWSMNIAFGYRYGGQLYNQTLIDRVETGDYSYNVDQRVYDDRWQKPGDVASFKGLVVTTPTYKTSRFVQNEKTLECQNINVQYDLRSPQLLKKYGLEVLSITANMADPFYISSVKRERGLDYPFSRMFSLTLNATF